MSRAPPAPEDEGLASDTQYSMHAMAGLTATLRLLCSNQSEADDGQQKEECLHLGE